MGLTEPGVRDNCAQSQQGSSETKPEPIPIDHAYIEARNRLIPLAEMEATRVVSRTRHREAWDLEFLRAMQRLTEEFIHHRPLKKRGEGVGPYGR